MSNISIILDLETLSRSPSALITEIGAVAFHRDSFAIEDELDLTPDFFLQLATGRHVCPETIAFHRQGGTLPRIHPSSSATMFADLHLLTDFFHRHRPHRVWIQGPDFDRPILEHFCQQYGSVLPWDFWRTRDTRTTWDTAFPGQKHAPRPHHALPDCHATLTDLKQSLHNLGRPQSA